MNAQIIYLGHSAWAVKADDIFIFDYDKPDAPDTSQGLDAGVVSLKTLKEDRVYFFSSHKHPDHYNRELNEAVNAMPNMTFITGAFKASFSRTITMRPRQTARLDDLTITTGVSTDEGVCYLVCSPQINLFHAGDHANWATDAPMATYRSEIDLIAGQYKTIHAAFLPVCYFGGQRAYRLTEGAFYAIQKLNPKLVFPMHGGGHEQVYQAFAKDAADAGIPNQIICAERIGDSFLCQE
jgi:L-ascorbate metabolism protein UlaG (beta-lactamase superfamily)